MDYSSEPRMRYVGTRGQPFQLGCVFRKPISNLRRRCAVSTPPRRLKVSRRVDRTLPGRLLTVICIALSRLNKYSGKHNLILMANHTRHFPISLSSTDLVCSCPFLCLFRKVRLPHCTPFSVCLATNG